MYELTSAKQTLVDFQAATGRRLLIWEYVQFYWFAQTELQLLCCLLARVWQVWNDCICRQDSDGDGKTNGEELGDPDSAWTPGQAPAASANLTHPGSPHISDQNWLTCMVEDEFLIEVSIWTSQGYASQLATSAARRSTRGLTVNQWRPSIAPPFTSLVGLSNIS